VTSPTPLGKRLRSLLLNDLTRSQP
jgi:hypothetical protein